MKKGTQQVCLCLLKNVCYEFRLNFWFAENKEFSTTNEGIKLKMNVSLKEKIFPKFIQSYNLGNKGFNYSKYA